jgi:hypothetical protein
MAQIEGPLTVIGLTAILLAMDIPEHHWDAIQGELANVTLPSTPREVVAQVKDAARRAGVPTDLTTY